MRQSLPQLAELLGRAGEDKLEQPFVTERLHERPVQPAGLTLLGDRREAVMAEPLRPLEQLVRHAGISSVRSSWLCPGTGHS